MKRNYRRVISILVVLCMMASLFPYALADNSSGGTDEHTYTYVGRGLDKEYDGEAVSINVSADIAVDGETGVLTADDVTLEWGFAGGALNEAPFAAGQYWLSVYISDENKEPIGEFSVNFVIWDKGHEHVFGSWSENNDGTTHSRTCEGGDTNNGCGYRETQPHNFGEWQPVSSYGEKGQYQYRTCSDCGFNEERTGVYTVIYDYETNGGASAAATAVEAAYGSTVDLTPTAVRNGYEFVGWNTDKDAHEALSDTWSQRNTIRGDVTLYAIFKKTQNVRFYSKNGTIQAVIPAEVYNNETTAYFPDGYGTGIYPADYEGYRPQGWCTDTAADAELVDLHDVTGAPMIPDVTKDYYAVYTRQITLTYDTNDQYGSWYETQTQYFNSAGNYSEAEFMLSRIPATTVVENFEYWAIGDKVKGEKHKAGETITLKENTTAYAVYTEDLQNITKYTITYDYAENGGTSMTNASNPAEIPEGEILSTANLGEGVKSGWEFVGWNTDKNAKEGLTETTVNDDVTLYAIYKKTVTASFYQPSSETAVTVSATLYNNDTAAFVTAPEPEAISGWAADGWRTDYNAQAADYKAGSIKIDADTPFYPIYKRYITLTYDTSGSSESVRAQSAIQYQGGLSRALPTFKLAAEPARDGYKFTGWALSTDGDAAITYNAGETVNLTENAVATAQWTEADKPKPEEVTVKYNASENGGYIISTTASQIVTKGSSVDPEAVKAEKAGWTFVGWNTDKDAHEALTELTVTDSTTLYAIFKKEIRANFYSGENADTVHAFIKETLYNNDKEISTTAPLHIKVNGWSFEGWRRDKHAVKSEFAAGFAGSDDSITITFSDNTDFYSVYSRQITVQRDFSENDSQIEASYTQYSNTGGGVESLAYQLYDLSGYRTENGETQRFTGWEVVTTDEEGNETVTEQPAGTVVSLDNNTTVRAKYVKVPEGALVPTVETVGSSVISPTASVVEKKVKNDGVEGNDIIREGFVYWSKLGDSTKYTVTTENTHMALEFLAPDTEYYYYAFAENAAGTAKGYIKSFRTEPDDNTPTALTISPEYVSLKKGDSYQLLATLLPVSAENKILWSSSDTSKVTVDDNGMLTAKAAGEDIITTATTEVGRLTAECIVDVTEEVIVTEMDFSEWHMASHTYNGYENGFDWDTEDADGGNHTIATAYLARWEGAVMEDSDKYPDYDPINRGLKKADEQYHIQNVDWLPARTSLYSADPLENDEEIKSALMENGAVYSLMCIDWDCFDDTYTNYYCPEEINYNGHAITIVGWDDNYSKDNFTGAYKPAKDGAFICKNSWGDGIGENGFFYISYYDANMGRMDSNAVVTGAESNTNYNKIYQYDPLGAVGYIGMDDTIYAANVFPENGKTLDSPEYLEAASFYTYHKNTAYDIYVVTDYKNSGSLANLTSPVASGEIKNSGYHTVNLNSPIQLNKGTRFAVVVKLSTPGECSYVYCEYPVYGYSSKAKAGMDEGYYSAEGKSWYDLADSFVNANFCIKAFTGDLTAKNSVQLYSAIDNENREYESNKVYTLDEAIEMGMPVNDRYLDFVSEKEKVSGSLSLMSAEGATVALGSMPSITKAGGNSVSFTEGARFPSRYNLNEMGLVSSVKDQGSWGTCWAHAMYASLESCMLRTAKTTSSDTGSKTLSLSRPTLTMTEGSSMTLAKKITPVSVEDKTVVWTSSNDKVAKVDTNGTIRALKAGSATISATTVSGGYSGYCSVVVEGDDADEVVSFEEKTVHKEIGDKFMVTYSVTPMKAESYNYNWISNNPAIASVNENGVITAADNGTAEISVLSDKGDVMDTVTVVVGNGFNYSITDIDTDGLAYADNTLSGELKVTVNSKADVVQSSTILLAIYDGSTMVGVVSRSAPLTIGDNQLTSAEISLEGIDNAKTYTIKCMAWEALGTILPLTETREKTLTLE